MDVFRPTIHDLHSMHPFPLFSDKGGGGSQDGEWGSKRAQRVHEDGTKCVLGSVQKCHHDREAAYPPWTRGRTWWEWDTGVIHWVGRISRFVPLCPF
jgi:hypothetical protein